MRFDDRTPPLSSRYVTRFMTKYALDVATGCWVWQAGTGHHGYAPFWNGTREVRAHRFSYETFVGPIPEGLEIDHLCRNSSCVNPAHLEPVTRAENNRRRWAVEERATHCHRGHPFAETAYWERDGKRRCGTCRNARQRAAYATRKAAA